MSLYTSTVKNGKKKAELCAHVCMVTDKRIRGSPDNVCTYINIFWRRTSRRVDFCLGLRIQELKNLPSQLKFDRQIAQK